MNSFTNPKLNSKLYLKARAVATWKASNKKYGVNPEKDTGLSNYDFIVYRPKEDCIWDAIL